MEEILIKLEKIYKINTDNSTLLSLNSSSTSNFARATLMTKKQDILSSVCVLPVNMLPFIAFSSYPKLKEKNEKTKTNFGFVIFRLFSKKKL